MESVDSCWESLRYVRAYVLAHSYPEALFLFAGPGHPRISEVRHGRRVLSVPQATHHAHNSFFLRRVYLSEYPFTRRSS